MTQASSPVSVLSIAGSDTSGGAGIQADIKTISVCGAYALTAITAITAQDEQGVRGLWPVTPEQLQAQIRAALAYQPAAIKIGMLANASLVNTVADVLAECVDIPLILDTVIVASSGAHLLDNDGVDALRARLLPRALLATPNATEARALFGDNYLPVATLWAQKNGRHLLITGGDNHSGSDNNDEYCTDTWIQADGSVQQFTAPRIETRNQRGTGCTLTAAIASLIAQGLPLADAIDQARGFVRRALAAAQADKWPGSGPLKHFHEFDMQRFQEA